MSEPRLIDANEVRDEILHDPDYDNDTINHFLDVIDYAPTIDAVPVCKECRFSEPHGDFWYCYKIHAYTPKGFGCNQGTARATAGSNPSK